MYSPLIELVDCLEVHIGALDHVFVDEIEGGVSDELVKVTVVVFAHFFVGRVELHLKVKQKLQTLIS